MSANGPQEEAALAQQVEAASRECTALCAALRRARRSRLVFLLLVVVFVGAIALAFIGLYRDVRETFVKELPAMAQERFEKNSDTYMREIHTLVDNAGPKIQEAFLEQVKQDMPKYAHSAEEEREKFLETLKTELESKLQSQYKRLLEQQQKTLESEFKDIDPDKQKLMMANIDRAVQKLVKKYYIDELESQVRQLYATWDAIPAAAPPKKDELPLEDQFKADLLEMLRYKLAHTQGLASR